MKKIGSFVYLSGLLITFASFFVAMTSGVRRREFFSTDIETLAPALFLFFGGLGMAAFGVSISAVSTAWSTRKALAQTRKVHSDPRLNALAQLGMPIKSGQTFEDIASDVIRQGNGGRRPVPGPDVTPHRARIEVILPPAPSDSWLGGRPCLPVDVKWPSIQDAPATFIGQFALKDLPTGIWGGLGPKEGWLVIFAGHEGNSVRVLHTKTLGETREYPSGYTHFGTELTSDKSAIANILYGDTSRMISRWPVRIVPDDASHNPNDHRDEDQSRAGFYVSKEAVDFDLCNPIWAPFDWPLTQALMAMGLDLVAQAENLPQWYLEKLEREGVDLSKNAEHNRVLREKLENLSARIDQMAARYAFSDEIRRVLFDELAGLYWTDKQLLWSLSRPEILKTYESYARQHYAKDPAALPHEIRQKFEPFWLKQAESEMGFIGGEISEAFQAAGHRDQAVLLDLNSSDLIGWIFGDVSQLGVFLSADHLASNRLEHAQSCTTHGHG